jgi:Zn-finger nucleic acid-binding protein
MEPAHVIGEKGVQIRIDVDRDGGVFLDHGELAQLLDAGDIQNVITNVKSQILSAKARYQHAGDHRVK